MITVALRPIPAESVRLAKTTLIAVRRRFPVITDVPRPTPAVSVPLVRVIRIVTYPINPAITVVLPQTLVANALPANLVLHRQTRPAAPMGRNLVPTVAAGPDCVVKGIPILTLVPADTRRAIPGEVRLRPRPRPVLAVLLREPVTKPRRIPTATVVPADIRKQAVP